MGQTTHISEHSWRRRWRRRKDAVSLNENDSLFHNIKKEQWAKLSSKEKTNSVGYGQFSENYNETVSFENKTIESIQQHILANIVSVRYLADIKINKYIINGTIPPFMIFVCARSPARFIRTELSWLLVSRIRRSSLRNSSLPTFDKFIIG